jgi:hypothetical protein
MDTPEERRPLVRRRRKWDDNIRTDFREIDWEGVDSVHLAEDRDQWQVLVNMVMNLWLL